MPDAAADRDRQRRRELVAAVLRRAGIIGAMIERQVVGPGRQAGGEFVRGDRLEELCRAERDRAIGQHVAEQERVGMFDGGVRRVVIVRAECLQIQRVALHMHDDRVALGRRAGVGDAVGRELRFLPLEVPRGTVEDKLVAVRDGRADGGEEGVLVCLRGCDAAGYGDIDAGLLRDLEKLAGFDVVFQNAEARQHFELLKMFDDAGGVRAERARDRREVGDAFLRGFVKYNGFGDFGGHVFCPP